MLLQGTVRLLSLRASPSAARHRYLLLSSDESAGAAGAWTSVLETGEEGLQSAELPGLHTDAATLLAGPLAGGCMLQVTTQVRLPWGEACLGSNTSLPVFVPCVPPRNFVTALEPPTPCCCMCRAPTSSCLAAGSASPPGRRQTAPRSLWRRSMVSMLRWRAAPLCTCCIAAAQAGCRRSASSACHSKPPHWRCFRWGLMAGQR